MCIRDRHTENGELDLDGLIDRRSRRSLGLLKTLLAAIPRIVPDLRTFSLRDTHLDGTVAPALRAFLQALPNLKAVWLNGNPALFNETEDPYASSIIDEDMLQQQFALVNRKLTPAYGAWTLCYLGDAGCEHHLIFLLFLLYLPQVAVSYTHLRAHETSLHLVCRLLLEKRISVVTWTNLVVPAAVLVP